MTWLWTSLAVIVSLYLLNQLLRLKNKKRLPPGLVALPIIGHFHLLGTNPHRDLQCLAQKHGPIMYMRFGFVPTIVVSSPAAAEQFLKTHDLVFAGRPRKQATKYLGYDYRDMIFSSYGPYWRNMRKLCTLELLSSHKVNQFKPMRRAEVNLLVDSLKQAALVGQTVDLSSKVSGQSTDMICLMLFGRKYADRDLDDQKGFKALITDMSKLFGEFNLADHFPYVGVLDLQGLTRKMKALAKVFDEFLEKIIDDHVPNKQEERARDLVDTMMRIVESGEAGFEFDRSHVKVLLLALFIAGEETSASTVEWALSELLRHPMVMTKLQKELEAVVGMEHMVEEAHLDQLEYLDFVIKETLRLHPVVPLLLPHEAMEDCTVEGFHIPKKSLVLVNVWAIGRDSNVWRDPETFAPERFIGSNIDLKGQDFQLIPFGSGRRSCPGIQLGLTVVRLMVAQLVHCFDWKLPGGMKSSELDMSENFGAAVPRAIHLMAIPSYRLHK